MADGQQTYTLEGQTYNVPSGTSMDELDEYIKGQKKTSNAPDALTKQTDAAARQAGESTRATRPVLPTPQPTSALSRVGSGLAAGSLAMVPHGMPSWEDIATSGLGPLPSMARGVYEGYKESRNAGQGVLPSVASGLGGTIGLDAPGIRERAKQGDIAGIIGEAIPSLAAATLLPEGTRKVAEHIGPESNIPAAHQTILDLTGKTPADLEFKKTVEKALPDIAHEARKGDLKMEGNARVGELHQRLQDRLGEIWHQEHEPQVARHSEMPINIEDARTAAKAAVSPELRANNPAAARAADRWIDSALTDEASGTVGKADKMLRGINAETPNLPEPFKNVGKLARNAAAQTIRDTIDNALHDAGEEGVKGPNTRWGALREVTDSIGDRLNHAGNRPFSTWDALRAGRTPMFEGAAIGAALGEVGGHGGAAIGGALGGAGGLATSVVRDFMNEPGHKASRAFSNLAGSSLQPDTVGTPSYVGRPPAGLLPPATPPPIITPPPRGIGLYPEESRVTGVAAEHVPVTRGTPPGTPGFAPEYSGGEGRIGGPDVYQTPPLGEPLDRPAERPGAAPLDNSAVKSTVSGERVESTPPANDRAAAIQKIQREQGVGYNRAVEIHNESGGERRSAPRATALNSAPPDPIRSARIDELRKIIRDPSAPERDRNIAQAQLEDYEAHPGERNEFGDSVSALKKPKPTMSRAEAEAATTKRLEGRNARFADRPKESPGPAELDKETKKTTAQKKSPAAQKTVESWDDMIPGAEQHMEHPNVVAAPKPGETWYHGRGDEINFDPNRPAFFTRDKEGASWYAENRGDNEPNTGSFKLDIKKPARYRDLVKAVEATGSTEKDIQKNSQYEGENFSDHLYVPKVRDWLKNHGFDGYVGWDTLSNSDIEIAVPLNVKQIDIGKVFKKGKK